VKNEKVEYLGCDVVTILYVGCVGLDSARIGLVIRYLRCLYWY
jgi:hypothetical protein